MLKKLKNIFLSTSGVDRKLQIIKQTKSKNMNIHRAIIPHNLGFFLIVAVFEISWSQCFCFLRAGNGQTEENSEN